MNKKGTLKKVVEIKNIDENQHEIFDFLKKKENRNS